MTKRKKKTERIFDLARFIGKNGGVRIAELRALFHDDLSERGVFRYLTTLLKAGVVTRSKAQYTMGDYWRSLFENVEHRNAIKALLTAGIEACQDEEVVEKAKELI